MPHKSFYRSIRKYVFTNIYADNIHRTKLGFVLAGRGTLSAERVYCLLMT